MSCLSKNLLCSSTLIGMLEVHIYWNITHNDDSRQRRKARIVRILYECLLPSLFSYLSAVIKIKGVLNYEVNVEHERIRKQLGSYVHTMSY